MNAATIIETSAGQLYAVSENTDPALAHVWNGIAVKRVKGGFGLKAKARFTLVRKAASRIVAERAVLIAAHS